MINFNLVEVINPSKITMSLMPNDFVREYAPAYGGSWGEASDLLHSNVSDYAIIKNLIRVLRKGEYFTELPKVQLPMCDLDDREEWDSRVANGMHRITALRTLGQLITFTPYYPNLPNEDMWTEITLVFQEEISEEDDMNIFGWIRSMPLDNGEWVETLCSSTSNNTVHAYLDKVVDHKVLLKKIHSLALLDEFSELGLIEIRCEDVSDDEGEMYEEKNCNNSFVPCHFNGECPTC